MIEITKEDLRILLVCSFRYTLPRHSYMPSLMVDLLKEYWNDLGSVFQEQILEDIDKELKLGLLDEWATTTWQGFLDEKKKG